MELTNSLKTLLTETAKALKGSARRLFMARTVKDLGPGGQHRAARELRPAIVDRQRQADPQFRSTRRSTRLTAAEVRRQLIAQKGYLEATLPSAETIGTKLNALGYYPQKVAKSQPQKNSRKPTPSSTR